MMDGDVFEIKEIRKKQKELRDLLRAIKKINARRHPFKALGMLNKARKLDQELKRKIGEITTGVK